MPKHYACSVIIPTYNREVLLRKTLCALQEQSIGKDEFEVIVVDDGSSDNTAETVGLFEGNLNIRYFWQEDRGFRAAAARNAGIAKACAPVCVLLDSGVIAAPGLIAAHLNAHSAPPRRKAVVGYVHSVGVRLVSMGISHDDAALSDDESVDESEDGRERFYRSCGDDLSKLISPWLLFWTCNVSVQTRHLEEIGMFDEDFCTWGVEDIELGLRLHKAGFQFAVNRQAAAVHLPHPISPDQRKSHAINFRYMMRKHRISAKDAIQGLKVSGTQ